jgi:hypothetical protein
MPLIRKNRAIRLLSRYWIDFQISRKEVVMQKIMIGSIIFLSLLSGCAHLDFGHEGLTYYDPNAYLFVTTTRDCVTTATVLVVPGTKKAVKFESGYGTASLSVTLSNGMVTSAGQITDTQIPATITAIAGLIPAAVGMMKGARVELPEKGCTPTASLYPIVSGVVVDKPIPFPVK